MLAVSVFGDPNMDASFLYSFDGTDNALLQAAVSGNGLVLAFDDAVSASDRKNWKTFLYNICVGVDKKRLDGELRMKRQIRHTNVLLLSSEYPLVQRSDDTGLRARVFEVSDPLCSSAEQSLAIKAAVLKNYACAGEAYAQHVVHLEHEQLMKDYKRCTDILIQVSGAAGKSDIGGRACTKLSTILLAAEEFNTCFANTGCAVDIKALIRFLAVLVKDSDRGKDDKGMVLHAPTKGRSPGARAFRRISRAEHRATGCTVRSRISSPTEAAMLHQHRCAAATYGAASSRAAA